MERLSDATTESLSPRSGKRSQIGQACDPCRRRKVRCQLNDAPDDTATRGVAEDVNQSDYERQSTIPCKRCRKYGLECSFDLPVGRRGPKGPRTRRQGVLPTSTVEEFRPSSSSARSHELQSEPEHQSSAQDPTYGTLDPFSPERRLARLSSHHSPSVAGNNTTSPLATFSAESRQLVSPQHISSAPASYQSHPSPYGVFINVQYSTDDLCPRELLLEIINDYLQHLYPILPVIHRPTFRANLERRRDASDKAFLSLLLALCAFTVGCLPRRFNEHQRGITPIQFRSRLEMIDYCHSKCVQFRGPRYFDEISHTKWAIPCLLYAAYFHVGEHNKSRMIESEAILFARMLELHRTSAYAGLNPIETQLRKKAFWLMFYSYVHLQFQDQRQDKIAFIDCSMLHDLRLGDLLPACQDDEQITETEYLTLSDGAPTLTAGFNLRSRLFWTAVVGRSATAQPASQNVHCHCTRRQHAGEYMEHLHSRIHELKYMLDDAPWFLRQWGSKVSDDQNNNLPYPMQNPDVKFLDAQLATMRADIHTTHLWLQSIIMDQADALSIASISASPVNNSAGPKSNWFARENICHQLLLLLWSIPQSSLEALGLYLVYKVRDVAGTLLSCPFTDTGQPEDAGPASRAKEYLKAFTDKLRELDKSETINSLSLQTWVDTDRNEAGKYYYW